MAKRYQEPVHEHRIAPDTDFSSVIMLGPDATAETMVALSLDGLIGVDRPDGLAPVDWGLAPVDPPIKKIMPEFAFQIRDFRGTECPSDAELVELAGVVRNAMGSTFGNAWIAAQCTKSGSSNPVITIGMWPFGVADELVEEGRLLALRTTDLLDEDGGDTFGILVSRALIVGRMMSAWNQMPKRFDHSGEASETGSIRLTSIDLEMETPDTIKMTVKGYDSAPFPDVKFTATYTDILSVDGSPQVRVDSTSDLDTKNEWHIVLGVLFLAIPTAWTWGLAAAFFGQAYVASQQNPRDFGETLGQIIASALLRDHILLPPNPLFDNGIRLNMNYNRLNVVEGGVFTGGTYVPTPREPSVTITGPAQIVASQGAGSATRLYRAEIEDLLPGATITWSGDANFTNPTSMSTGATFSLIRLPENTVVTKRISVVVTDSDGVSASADLDIEIHPVEMADIGIPPICIVKPWLPQCR